MIRDRGHVVSDKLEEFITTVPKVIDDDDARGISGQINMKPVKMELDDLETQCHSLFSPSGKVRNKEEGEEREGRSNVVSDVAIVAGLVIEEENVDVIVIIDVDVVVLDELQETVDQCLDSNRVRRVRRRR